MDLTEAIQRVTAAADEAASAAREASTAAHAATAAAGATTSAIQTLTVSQAILRRDFLVLWHAVYGADISPPAPPPPGVDPSTEPIPMMSRPPLGVVALARSSETTGDLAELKGQVLAIRTELAQQSTAMGVGKRGLDYLLSRAGQRSILRVVGSVGAVVAGIGAIVAGMSSPRLPAVAAPPTTMIVLTALPLFPDAGPP